MSKLEKLKEFFKSNNITYEKIEIISNDQGFSVRATEDLEEGIKVCSIPKESVLSIRNTACADILEENELGGVLGLAIAIMFEASLGEKSPWYNYLQSIPAFENVPCFWSDKDKSFLASTDVGKSLAQDIQYLHEDYKEHVLPLIEKYAEFDGKFMTLERWMNATSLVTSRAFQVDEFHGESLVPLADLFNHKTGAEHVHFEGVGDVCPTCGASDGCDCEGEEWEDEASELDAIEEMDEDGDEAPELAEAEDIPELDEETPMDNDILEMVTVRPAKKGDELFNTYGDHSNSSLLRLYGFVDQENEFSCVRIDRKDVLEQFKEIDSERLEDRLGFWDQVGKDIVDQLGSLDESGEPEEDFEEEHEHSGDCCGDDHEHDAEHEDGDMCCDDENCEGCDQEDPLLDDFYIEQDGKPSFALAAFVNLLAMSQQAFETIAVDLNLAIEALVKIRNNLQEAPKPKKKGKAKIDKLQSAVDSSIKAVVQARLSEYGALDAEPTNQNQRYALMLRTEEISILQKYLKNQKN
ncbi:hypothetical protein HDV06_005335 [Boothiomyces sp. JEL0866]|nr:hypothetical protein HDV06_005335 [Boothiomyces sp. JEL0866]